ncbi:MAG: hypothetical protein OXG33_13015 [Chloroflexi bacterium]|nr:hypothetical protein [Chloroflexota bacterium]
MLAPDSRELLLDALRPPPRHSLDHAVATTFTLDLEVALMVPLAFAGFQFDEQSDPVEIMQALRAMSGRMDIFCQAGAIHAGKWPSDLVALLESSIHAAAPPRRGHIFHPKTWVLRFRGPTQELSYRLLVLSRNLTTSRNWDTILRLDGQPRQRTSANSESLARFVRALPELAILPILPDRRELLDAFADELVRVEWELPSGVREAHFHPIGLRNAPPFPVEEHFSGYRRLAISPFLGAGALRRILRPRAGQTSILVSCGEELNALPSDALEHVDVYEIDPTASLSGDDVEDDGFQTLSTNLHAKLFVVERARLAHLFVGSANATHAGLSDNVEFLCELVGSVAKFGVNAIVGDDAPFRAMLMPYVASAAAEGDEAGEAERGLTDLLFGIASRVGFRTTVTKEDDGWVARITANGLLPPIPEDSRLTIAPHNRDDEAFPIAPAEPVDVELPPRELADITAFLRLTASRTVEGKPLQCSAVVCSRLHGAPDERFQTILARQIDTPEKFMRLLALLIGFAADGGVPIAATGDGQGSWSAGAAQGVLELLARALSERPDSIDHLEEIVEHLRRSQSVPSVLPRGWDDVWLPALKARRAMRAADP